MFINFYRIILNQSIIMNVYKKMKKKKKIQSDVYGDEVEIEEEKDDLDEIIGENSESEELNEEDREELYR